MDSLPASRRPSVSRNMDAPRLSPEDSAPKRGFVESAIATLTPAVLDERAAHLLAAAQFSKGAASPLSPIPYEQPLEMLVEAQFKTPEGRAGRRRKPGGADVHLHIMEPAQEDLLPPNSKLVVPVNSPAASMEKNAEEHAQPASEVGEGQMLQVISPGELVALYANNQIAMPRRGDLQSPKESDQPRSAPDFTLLTEGRPDALIKSDVELAVRLRKMEAAGQDIDAILYALAEQDPDRGMWIMGRACGLNHPHPLDALRFSPSMLDELVSPPQDSKQAVLEYGQGLNFSSPSEPDIARSPGSDMVEVDIRERKASHQSSDADPPAVVGPPQRRGCNRVQGSVSVACLGASSLLLWLGSMESDEATQAVYATLCGVGITIGMVMGVVSLPPAARSITQG